MATVTKTIGSGKDHATIALWEANVGNFGTDIYKGVISTNDNFDEANQIVGGTGTPSITSYLWLTTDDANKHAGVAGTGHGRIYNTTNAHVLVLESSFARVSWLDIEQGNIGDSLEGIRVINTTDCLIQYCIIWSDQDIGNQDGIYCPNQVVTNLRIDNCVVYGWGRGNLHLQQWHTTSRAINWDVDHVSSLNGGLAPVRIESDGITDDIAMEMFNVWGATCATSPFSDGDNLNPVTTPDGTVVWSGSDNAVADPGDLNELDGTDSMTNTELCTSGIAVVTKSSGSWIVVKNVTAGSIDLEPLDNAAGNLIAETGVDRIGSEPDARQDFAVAINGVRGTTNVAIGAFIIASGATTFFETIAVASTMVAAIAQFTNRPQTLAVASTMTAAMTRVTTWARTLAVASTMVAAMGRVTTWFRTLAVASTMTAAMTRATTMFQTIAVSSTMVAALGLSRTFLQTIAVASTMVAAMARVKIGVVVIAVSSTMTAAMQKTIKKTLAVSSTMTAGLGLVRTFLQTNAVASTMVAALARAAIFPETLAATSVMVAALVPVKILFSTAARLYRHGLATVGRFFHSGH